MIRASSKKQENVKTPFENWKLPKRKICQIYICKQIHLSTCFSFQCIRLKVRFCEAKKDIVLYYYISAHVSSVVSFINRFCTAVEGTIRI